MKDKKGNTLKVGDLLIPEQYPNSTPITITKITKEYIETDMFFIDSNYNKCTHRLNQTSLLNSQWIKIS